MNRKIETVTYYMGKPIAELSRDELIEALSWASKEIERLWKQNKHERDFTFEVFVQPKFKE